MSFGWSGFVFAANLVQNASDSPFSSLGCRIVISFVLRGGGFVSGVVSIVVPRDATIACLVLPARMLLADDATGAGTTTVWSSSNVTSVRTAGAAAGGSTSITSTMTGLGCAGLGSGLVCTHAIATPCRTAEIASAVGRM